MNVALIKNHEIKPSPAKLSGETVLTELEVKRILEDAFPKWPIRLLWIKHCRVTDAFQDARTRSEIAKVLKDLAAPITVSTTPGDAIGHEVYLIKKKEFDRLIAELEESCQKR